MRDMEKGCVFEDERKIRFLITGEAVSWGTGETVYLCQELEAPYRQTVWTAQEISACVGTESKSQAVKENAGYQGAAGQYMAGQATGGYREGDQQQSVPDSGEKTEPGNRFVGSVEIDDRYRRRIRREEQENEMTRLQNQMIRFLDADTYGEKLEILASMKGKATETMLESMALSMDYQTGGNSAEEIYYSLERFLKTRKRYEGNRLR